MTKSEKEKLEVGDVLYAMVGYAAKSYNARYTIARVTKTMAFSEKGTKFKREIEKNEYVHFLGSSRSGGNYYAKLETEDIKTDFLENKLRVWASGLRINTLSIDSISKIKKIVDGEK